MKFKKASMLLVLAGVFFSNPALSAGEEPTILESGQDWQLIAVPQSVVPSSSFRPKLPVGQSLIIPSAKVKSTATESGTPVKLYKVDSAEGLNQVPLAPSIKADLLEGGFPTNGSLVIDKDVADAIADGSEYEKYGQYAVPDEDSGTLNSNSASAFRIGCKTGWRYSDQDRSINITPYARNESLGAKPGQNGISGNLGINAALTGNLNAKITYAYKKSRICIPYSVRLESVKVNGKLNFNDTNLTMTGSATYTHNWETKAITLYDKDWWFFVGPVPVRVGIEVPYYVGYNAQATIAGNFGINSGLTGDYTFDYICTSSSCSGNSNSTASFGTTNPQIIAGASVNVGINPYFKLEGLAYLYSKWLASVGLGAQVSLPSRYWGYYGNTCGDANGDGQNETVKSSIVDINAQIALYAKWQFTGKENWRWIDLKGPGVKVTDFNQEKGDFFAIRKNLYFKDFSPAETSALTPIINTQATAYQAIPMTAQVKMRDCVPFKDAVNYTLEWGDGTSESILGASNNVPTTKYHTYTALGMFHPKLTATSDSVGRKFQSASSITGLVVAPADTRPPEPVSPQKACLDKKPVVEFEQGSYREVMKWNWNASRNTCDPRVVCETRTATGWKAGSCR